MRLLRYNREDINSQQSALKTKRKINYVKGYFTSESGKIILDSNIILSKIFRSFKYIINTYYFR